MNVDLCKHLKHDVSDCFKDFQRHILVDTRDSVKVLCPLSVAMTTINSYYPLFSAKANERSEHKTVMIDLSASEFIAQGKRFKTPRLSTYIKSSLLDYQIPHIEKIIDNFLNVHCCVLDSSEQGLGKTYTSCAVAKTLQLPLIVVCPAVAIDKWTSVAEEYDVDFVIPPISGSMIGRRKNDGSTSHRLLHFQSGRYYGTKKLARICEKGALFVFDEIHMMKNNSQRTKACCEISRMIMARGSHKSKLLCLSGTPTDGINKAEKCMFIQILCLNGRERELFLESRHKMGRCDAISSGVNYLRRMCGVEPGIIYDSLSEARTDAIELMESVLPNFHVEMPPIFPKTMSIKNALIEVPDTMKDEANECVCFLKEIMDRGGKYAFENMMSSLEDISRIKSIIITREVKRLLQQKPNCKVVIFARFLNAIHYMLDNIPFSVGLYGETSKHSVKIINKFQAPDLQVRVLVANPTVAGTAIDLDDKNGAFPRYIFAIPDYFFLDSLQALSRCNRATTASDTQAFFVYFRGMSRKESHILSRLLQRKEQLSKMVKRELLFPDKYEEVDIADELTSN